MELAGTKDLNGKVALVTGGASGIGRATVARLAEEGAQVVVADVDETLGAEVAEAAGGRFARADVSSPGDWDALVASVREHEGGLDLVHLNAGVATFESDIIAVTDEQYRRVLGVNVDGVVDGCRAVVPLLEERGGGAVVVTASIAGLAQFAADPVYTLTKHAVVGLVRALAPALEPRGISLNAICPGVVDTPLLGAEPKAMLETMGFPIIPPSAIADAVVRAVRGGRTGEAWVCQAGVDPVPFEFGLIALRT
ncbi:SDR family NAD(P)-dependent oxidoreductase [soil metagenome]